MIPVGKLVAFRRLLPARGLLPVALWIGLVPVGVSAKTPETVEYGDAVLRDWVQPDYPDQARKAKLEGDVQVEFVVGLDGKASEVKVVESTNNLFDKPALAAVRRWTFDPAVEDGRPAASAMGVRIEFRLAQLKRRRAMIAPEVEELMPHGLKRTPARPVRAPDPEYPAELEEQKISGEVRMEFTVDEEGNVRDPLVLWASHPAFVEMALRAAEKTHFEPARQGPLAKATRMEYPVTFDSLGTKRAEILEASHLSIVGDTMPDVLPLPIAFPSPVYPRARLLAGEAGSAQVEFTLDEKGRPGNVTVADSSARDFAAALTAATEAWLFQPAMNGGARAPVKMRAAYEFVPPTGGAVARLVASLRPGGEGVGSAKGLDRRLKPLWRGFPVYPAALKAEQACGEAEIEFIVDRDGRVRLPWVVSAPREEFGWAAATAISQWVFERPMRGTVPVDVRVRISVDFTPPRE